MNDIEQEKTDLHGQIKEGIAQVKRMQATQIRQLSDTMKMMDTFIDILESRQHSKRDLIGVLLLADMKKVFDHYGESDKLQTQLILEALTGGICVADDAPWGDYRGKPITAHALGRQLRKYGIKSRQVRSDGRNTRHYFRSDFEDVWSRY